VTLPKLRKFPAGARTMVGKTTWEKHPDGAGGYRPILPAARGTVSEPCPHCGAPLVREGTNALIRRSVFGCEKCHMPSGGADVRVSPPKSSET
jgi:hypothetical protein